MTASATSPIHVVGLGAQTALGRSVLSSAAAVRGKLSAYALHPYLIDRMGQRVTVARAPWIPAEIELATRIRELSIEASDEALAPFYTALAGARVGVGVIVGFPAPRPGYPVGLEKRLTEGIARRHAPHVSIVGTRSLSLGHVAGMSAIEEGCRLIAEGAIHACLVGGADSYIDAPSIEWLDWTGQLLAEGNPRGFVPGEAAAFCLLASEALVQHCAFQSLARILGAKTSVETKLRRDRAICLGEGLTGSIRGSLQALPDGTQVDQIIYDFNGQPHRAEEYGFASMRLGLRFRNPEQALTPAECCGDVGAASGPLFASLAIVGGHKRYLPGPHHLLAVSAMVAERSSCLLRVEPRPGGPSW